MSFGIRIHKTSREIILLIAFVLFQINFFLMIPEFALTSSHSLQHKMGFQKWLFIHALYRVAILVLVITMVIIAQCNDLHENRQTVILWVFGSIFILFFLYEIGWLIYGFFVYEKQTFSSQPLRNYGPFILIFGTISAMGEMLFCCLRHHHLQFDRQYNHLSRMRQEGNDECGIKVDMTSSKIVKGWVLIIVSINLPLILFNILFYILHQKIVSSLLLCYKKGSQILLQTWIFTETLSRFIMVLFICIMAILSCTYSDQLVSQKIHKLSGIALFLYHIYLMLLLIVGIVSLNMTKSDHCEKTVSTYFINYLILAFIGTIATSIMVWMRGQRRFVESNKAIDKAAGIKM